MRLPGAFDAAGSRLLASWLFLLVTRTEAAAAAVTPRYLVYPPPGSGAPTKVQVSLSLSDVSSFPH